MDVTTTEYSVGQEGQPSFLYYLLMPNWCFQDPLSWWPSERRRLPIQRLNTIHTECNWQLNIILNSIITGSLWSRGNLILLHDLPSTPPMYVSKPCVSKFQAKKYPQKLCFLLSTSPCRFTDSRWISAFSSLQRAAAAPWTRAESLVSRLYLELQVYGLVLNLCFLLSIARWRFIDSCWISAFSSSPSAAGSWTHTECTSILLSGLLHSSTPDYNKFRLLGNNFFLLCTFL